MHKLFFSGGRARALHATVELIFSRLARLDFVLAPQFYLAALFLRRQHHVHHVHHLAHCTRRIVSVHDGRMQARVVEQR